MINDFCKNCSWYVDRPKTEQEYRFAMSNPNKMIDTNFCALCGCDGSRFIDKNRNNCGADMRGAE